MDQHFWQRAGIRLAITSTLCVAGALAFASRASADHDRGDHGGQHHFTNADLRGRYAASFQGQIDGTPVATEGFFIADGAGKITSATRTLSFGGTRLTQTFTCTYDVAADGTGTGTADCNIERGQATESYTFVLEDEGSGVRFLLVSGTDGTNFVVLGSATRK